MPTIDADEGFFTAAQTWLLGNPKEIIIITSEEMREPLEQLAIRVDGANGRIRILTVAQANKRRQMAEGIKATTTDIIVFADDDALWPPTMLPYILACFEDQSIGGVGTSQIVKPVGDKMTVWEVLAAMRLSIRNIEIAASTHIDGGIPCLSGRTAAYRSIILKDPSFLDGFTNDYWLGKYHLNSGDDKFLTRWLVSHGWGTYVQCCKEAELQSTMKPDWRFLKQVLRWTRNTWRSDLRSIFMERHIWTRHPYVAYMMIDKFLNPLTLLVGPCLVVYLCIKSGYDNGPEAYRLPAWNILLSWIGWLLREWSNLLEKRRLTVASVTRSIKLAPHFWQRPQDIIHVPAWLLFGYYFAVMKIYTLFTLHEVRRVWGDVAKHLLTDEQVGWGTRALGTQAPTTAPFGEEKPEHIPHAVPADFFSETGEMKAVPESPEEKHRLGTPRYYGQMQEVPLGKSYKSVNSSAGAEGIELYHDYLPQLARTPDLEYGRSKPVIRVG